MHNSGSSGIAAISFKTKKLICILHEYHGMLILFQTAKFLLYSGELISQIDNQ